MRFSPVPVPSDLLAIRQFESVHYADCYRCPAPGHDPITVDLLARLFFSEAMPSWIRRAIAFNERAQERAGKRPEWTMPDPTDPSPVETGTRTGPWKVVDRDATEIVFREDAFHLDFAFSLHVRGQGDDRAIEATTLVAFHGLPGKLYFAPVGPIHRRLVPRHMDAVLRIASRRR